MKKKKSFQRQLDLKKYPCWIGIYSILERGMCCIWEEWINCVWFSKWNIGKVPNLIVSYFNFQMTSLNWTHLKGDLVVEVNVAEVVLAVEANHVAVATGSINLHSRWRGAKEEVQPNLEDLAEISDLSADDQLQLLKASVLWPGKQIIRF